MVKANCLSKRGKAFLKIIKIGIGARGSGPTYKYDCDFTVPFGNIMQIVGFCTYIVAGGPDTDYR